MKQAYLITAYKNFDELYELAEILSKTAYVFIHVDEKAVRSQMRMWRN